MDLHQRIHLTYAAFAAGNMGVVENAFDDNIEFATNAPVDIFPYLSRRKGRQAVVTSLIRLREEFEVLKYEPVSITAERDAAAVIVLSRMKHRDRGQMLSTLLAHFLHFKDGRITDFRAFVDSLDVAGQWLGRSIELPR
jgi:ketosteroid isomerase-like protein